MNESFGKDLSNENSSLIDMIEGIRNNSSDKRKRTDEENSLNLIEEMLPDINLPKINDNCSINLTMSTDNIQIIVDRLLAVFSPEKSPVQVLNEIFPINDKTLEIIYEGSYGTPHQPMHYTVVKIKEIGSFTGQASSKQDSRQIAAKSALEFISGMCQQHTSQRKKVKKSKTKKTNVEKPERMESENVVVGQTTSGTKKDEHVTTTSIGNIGRKGDFDDFIRENSAKLPPIISTVENSGICYDLEFMMDKELCAKIYQNISAKCFKLFDPVRINKVIEKAIENVHAKTQYTSLDLWRYKELSCFVLISDLDHSIQVLSVGAGTKCIQGDRISLEGDVVQDSHAEIIARRSLLHVLYDHLNALLDNNLNDEPEFILEPANDGSGKFRLKKHLKLYLYITSPPCGDARIFNLAKSSNTNKGYVPKGTLRCKIDRGQGTVPMPRNYISTWDGILIDSQRLVLMSCSDKIALWNVVGVQGSLLSFFLKPIYIEGMLVSNLFHYEHLIRALHGRIDQRKLESKLLEGGPYRLNECKIGVHVEENSITIQNSTPQFPIFSHNWHHKMVANDDSEDLEITRTETGTNFFNDYPSRLCKRKLLDRFLKLVKDYPKSCPALFEDQNGSNDGQMINGQINYETYQELKNASKEYQNAKLALYETLLEKNLRTWVKAPTEVDLFQI